MSFQQTPVFPDVCRYYSYPVQASGSLKYVLITAANGLGFGTINLKPQNYFVATALRCSTNYDNVGGVFASASSDAILARSFVPNTFTVKIERGDSNNYSNQPMTQAEICSSGYRAGKCFPLPVAYAPRSNLQFTFTDLTGLYLLTATSQGAAVPLTIKMFLEGFHVPIECWKKFTNLFPEFSEVFG